ncbi:hypothetical protein [Microcystis aeruginosa]|uniref:hypothetical protein n=1 Tax=Microcystis aeruginosa TaxID=1126 RepID=UPI001F4F3709|nr:hypothetical protein [Microcystis aeruginosa]
MYEKATKDLIAANLRLIVADFNSFWSKSLYIGKTNSKALWRSRDRNFPNSVPISERKLAISFWYTPARMG